MLSSVLRRYWLFKSKLDACCLEGVADMLVMLLLLSRVSHV